MGIMKEVLDTIKDLGAASTETVDVLFKKKRYSSISKRSLEGTLQFPVIGTRSLDVEVMQMVSKALERNYASFAQIAMTMAPDFNVKTDQDLASYLRKFHQNTNVKTGLGDVYNTATSLLESYTMLETKNVVVLTGVSEGSCPQINRDNQRQLEYLLEGVSFETLNDKYIPRRKKKIVGGDGSMNRYYIAKEAGSIGRKLIDPPTIGNVPYGPEAPKNRTFDPKRGRKKPSGTTINVNNNVGMPSANGVDSNGNKVTNDPNLEYKLPSQVLKDNDAKKANELVPTIMHMTVRASNGEGTVQAPIDFLIGIKATLHPVSSEEVASNIYGALQNRGKFFNFIRFTTGEISFVRDFLLNIGDLRNDVARQGNGNSRWWLALKRRKNMAKILNNIVISKKLLPNSTIVISHDESEFIRSAYGIDLMNPVVAEKLMREYFLLGFTIVDTSSQIVHFLFDGQIDYQSVSFRGLEKSTHSKNDMDFKDVLRLVQRV